ncbi:family 43 glycosylhydrolase [Rhodococcus sp. (in: high G+C Gram-positive bacteria)]|uniref:family 43 glycosylhydrolase n=1 Tax=Rhodococcus sp. TaxID=1831 RepID=UPI003BB6990D
MPHHRITAPRARLATGSRWWIGVALALATALVAPIQTAHANPVVEPVAADPTIIRTDDGMYYLYSTADDWGDGRGMHSMSMFASHDLVDWMYVGDVFDRPPAWHAPGKHAWAPSIHEFDGVYHLYYSLHDTANPCIGVATSPNADGPWTDLGRPVFCAHDVRIDGTIDPFVWDDGTTKTMLVGNFKGVYAIGLTPDGTAPRDTPVKVADDRFEGPFVVHRNGFYYLFVSAGNCCNGGNTAYRVLAGRSTSLTGPYLDRKGQDLSDGGGALILAGSDRWAGPGHNSVVTDDAGNDWIVYHASPRWDITLPSGAQRREGLIDRIVWADDWPDVGDGSPSSTRPELPFVDLPATVSLTVDAATAVSTPGGTVDATVLVTAGDSPFSGSLWLGAGAPGGGIGETVAAPIEVTLQPGEVRETTMTFLPPISPTSTYDLYALAGTSDAHVVDFGAVHGLEARPRPPAPGVPSGSAL